MKTRYSELEHNEFRNLVAYQFTQGYWNGEVNEFIASTWEEIAHEMLIRVKRVK